MQGYITLATGTTFYLDLAINLLLTPSRQRRLLSGLHNVDKPYHLMSQRRS